MNCDDKVMLEIFYSYQQSCKEGDLSTFEENCKLLSYIKNRNPDDFDNSAFLLSCTNQRKNIIAFILANPFLCRPSEGAILSGFSQLCIAPPTQSETSLELIDFIINHPRAKFLKNFTPTPCGAISYAASPLQTCLIRAVHSKNERLAEYFILNYAPLYLAQPDTLKALLDECVLGCCESDNFNTLSLLLSTFKDQYSLTASSFQIDALMCAVQRDAYEVLKVLIIDYHFPRPSDFSQHLQYLSSRRQIDYVEALFYQRDQAISERLLINSTLEVDDLKLVQKNNKNKI